MNTRNETLLTLVFAGKNKIPEEEITAMLAPLGGQAVFADGTLARCSFPRTVTLREIEDNCPELNTLLPHDRITQFRTPEGIRAAFFDMDSTIIAQECIDELAEMCGKGDEVKAITKGAMEKGWDFKKSLRERIQILIDAGLSESSLQQCYDERIHLTPGAKELLEKLNRDGVHTVLVSGGFTFFTHRIAERLGFKEHYGNLLIFNNGKLAGFDGCPKFGGRIIDKESKRDIVHTVTEKLDCTAKNALFVGDGGNDAFAVEAAGTGIAYRTNNADLRKVAAGCIDHGDLHALTHHLYGPRCGSIATTTAAPSTRFSGDF